MLPSFQFHHIGIATDSIKNTAKCYVDAGYSMSDSIFDPLQNVYIVFLEKLGMPLIELIEPNLSDINDSSKHPVKKVIENQGVAPYHICYEVENIDDSIHELKQKKYLPLMRPVNAIAIKNRKICFLFNKNAGLIEIVEKNNI